MANPLFASVIINNYNYASFLRSAIESALAQSYPYMEVIVVDDGSTDESWSIIAQFGQRIKAVLKENGGQASAFTVGFRVSKGDVVFFLDADDTLLPSAVAQAMPAFEDKRIAKVHWKLWDVDAQGTRLGSLTPSHPLPEGDLSETVTCNGPISFVNSPTSGNAWSRAFLEKVMPVRECGDSHGADAYLFTLVPMFGRIAKIDEPLGTYRLHPKNFSGHTVAAKLRRDLRRYEHHCRILTECLQSRGIKADPEQWKQNAWVCRSASMVEDLTSLLPESSTYILIDQVEWGEELVPGRRARPFLERNGQFWGLPVNDAAAVQELERMRGEGASAIVFPWNGFWWLEYYASFVAHVRANYKCVLENKRLIVFRLQ